MTETGSSRRRFLAWLAALPLAQGFLARVRAGARPSTMVKKTTHTRPRPRRRPWRREDFYRDHDLAG